MRTRVALLTHLQHTSRQDNLPEIGQKIADQAPRAGVAERFADPAGHTRLAVDLALLSHDDSLRRDMEWSVLTTATAHHPNTRYWLRTGPGSGEILRLVRLYEIHDLHRFPRGQDVVSYGRLVQGAKASAGKRDGTAGTKIGKAYLT